MEITTSVQGATAMRALSPGRLAPAVNAAPLALPLALFDEIDYGLVVCDTTQTIRFANQAARLELVRAKLLTRLGDQLGRAPGANGDLETAIRSAAQRGRRSLVRMATGRDRRGSSIQGPRGERTARPPLRPGAFSTPPRERQDATRDRRAARPPVAGDSGTSAPAPREIPRGAGPGSHPRAGFRDLPGHPLDPPASDVLLRRLHLGPQGGRAPRPDDRVACRA